MARCPDVVLRAPRRDRYAKEARRLHAALQRLLETPCPSSHSSDASIPDVFQGRGAGCSVEAFERGSFCFDVTAACKRERSESACMHSCTSGTLADVKEAPDETDCLWEKCTVAGIGHTPDTSLNPDGVRTEANTMNPTPECTSLQQWSQVPQDLREGCKIALRLREHVFHTHGYHASVGVSRTCLLYTSDAADE